MSTSQRPPFLSRNLVGAYDNFEILISILTDHKAIDLFSNFKEIHANMKEILS